LIIQSFILKNWEENVNIKDENGDLLTHVLVHFAFQLDPEMKDDDRLTIIDQILELFVRYHLDINATDVHGNTALHLAIIKNVSIRTNSRYLPKRREFATEEQLTNIHHAIDEGIFLRKFVSTLLEQELRPNVNALNKAGKSPLQLALETMQIDIAILLVEKGADVNTIHESCVPWWDVLSNEEIWTTKVNCLQSC
jgi:ankyrin repeat protein